MLPGDSCVRVYIIADRSRVDTVSANTPIALSGNSPSLMTWRYRARVTNPSRGTRAMEPKETLEMMELVGSLGKFLPNLPIHVWEKLDRNFPSSKNNSKNVCDITNDVL